MPEHYRSVGEKSTVVLVSIEKRMSRHQLSVEEKISQHQSFCRKKAAPASVMLVGGRLHPALVVSVGGKCPSALSVREGMPWHSCSAITLCCRLPQYFL